MLQLTKRIVAMIAVSVLTASSVNGYDLNPIVMQLAPSGPGATQTVLITNTHDVPIAIEVRAFKRQQLSDGTEARAPEEDLIISPPQMVIAPKASQSFKVQWVGDPAPEKELAYRIVSSQLPIKFKNQSDGAVSVRVDMSYRYEAALYIVPPRSTPLATLVSVAQIVGDDGENWLETKILSDGTRRAILDNPSLTLTPVNGAQSVTLEGDTLAGLANQNILVGNERVFRLPWPEGLEVGPVKGELRTAYTVFN